MRIGFLQQGTFHSEILDFLLELCIYLNYSEQILYLQQDLYDNVSIIKKTYPQLNLILKKTNDIYNDIDSDIKIISITSSFETKGKNAAKDFFEKYKNKIIHIAHSEEDVNTFNNLNYLYICLTPTITLKEKKYNYMFPFTKTIYNYRINKDNDKLIIMHLGWLLNKDLIVYRHLLLTKKVQLFIFCQKITEELLFLINEFKEHITVFFKKTTEQIIQIINENDIRFIIYAPSKKKLSSWSGSIAFAFNYNLILCTPEIVRKNLNLPKKNIITWEDNTRDVLYHKIKEKQMYIKSNGMNTDELIEFKKQNFERNLTILKYFLNIIL